MIDKASKAYVGGFLASIAGATDTHLIVLYRHAPSIDRRVSSRKCLEIAITVGDSMIWEGFPSVTELLIFAA